VRSKLDIAALRMVRSAGKDLAPDVLHPFYSRPLASAVLGTRFLAHAPPIVAVRGIERVPSLRDPSELISYLHPSVKAYACDSSAVVEALVKGGIRRDRCTPIYYFAPLTARCDNGRALLEQAGVPAAAFVIGTVATIRPVKGIDILLAAVKELALPNLHVALVGPIKDARVAAMLEDPQLKGVVHALGFRQNAISLASGFDLFVMPSRSEALCRALLEAMSQQVCPIVSDAGGMKEVVRHGLDGLVVNRENSSALARAISLLYYNRELRERMAESSYQRATTEFSPAKMVERAVGIYERVARTGGKVASAA
jgi:glycosyltransferase involved in cell wall biosynthesis